MFDKSEKFPDGWFFIKNNSNGYVLMVDNESHETGSPIVLSTLRTKDYNAQLWRHDPKGYLVNKKSGQVMDVAKGKMIQNRKCYKREATRNVGPLKNRRCAAK